MKKIIWNSIIPFILGLTIFAALILFNQLNQLAISSEKIIPMGFYVSWSIFILIGFFTFVPVIKLAVLPRPLKRPSTDWDPEKKRAFYFTYKKRVLAVSKKKSSPYKHVVPEQVFKNLHNANSMGTIKESLKEFESHIDSRADKLIRDYAGAVFASTAISQNGSLDAVFVLKLQIELLWKLAHLYNQKPGIKNLLNLYVQVFANVLASVGVAEIPVEEVVSSLMGKTFTSMSNMPIISSIGGKIGDSIFEGTVNALLSLRVGLVAKDYCKVSAEFDPQASRISSRKNSLKMINDIKYKDTISKLVKGKSGANV